MMGKQASYSMRTTCIPNLPSTNSYVYLEPVYVEIRESVLDDGEDTELFDYERRMAMEEGDG